MLGIRTSTSRALHTPITLRPAGRAWVGMGAISLVLASAGCATNVGVQPGTAPATPASATETAVAVIISTGQTVTGTGPSASFPGDPFPIPNSARSVVVDFTCEGDGGFTIELDDSMQLGTGTLSGICGEAQELAWPITGNTSHTLYVSIGDGVEWSATPHFSTAEFAYDEALSTDCARFSGVLSAFVNADDGVGTYDAFGEDEWAARVDDAQSDLRALIASSDSALVGTFDEVAAAVEAAEVGAVQAGWGEQYARISVACNTNHTPLIIEAEFGG